MNITTNEMLENALNISNLHFHEDPLATNEAYKNIFLTYPQHRIVEYLKIFCENVSVYYDEDEQIIAVLCHVKDQQIIEIGFNHYDLGVLYFEKGQYLESSSVYNYKEFDYNTIKELVNNIEDNIEGLGEQATERVAKFLKNN